jgi:hypothetical protein
MDDALGDLIVYVGDARPMTDAKEREISDALHAALKDGRVTKTQMLDEVVFRSSIYIPQAFADFTRYMIKHRLLCLIEAPACAQMALNCWQRSESNYHLRQKAA